MNNTLFRFNLFADIKINIKPCYNLNNFFHIYIYVAFNDYKHLWVAFSPISNQYQDYCY